MTFTGEGEELRASATADGPAESRLSARGTLLPVVRLEGTASALDDWANADFVYDAAQAGPALTGRMRTAALVLDDLGSVPEQSFDLAYDTQAGVIQVNQVEGGGSLRLEGGQLTGALTVPLATVAGPVTVAASVSGTLEAPEVRAQLEGALSGTVDASLVDGVSARVSVPATSVMAGVPELEAAAGLLQEPLDLSLELAPDGTWLATARTDVQSGEEATRLSADLTGSGLTYAGQVVVTRSDAQVATADVGGEAADLRASLDLGKVDWAAVGAAFGIDLEVTGEGMATFGTQPLEAGLTLDLTARSAGNELRVYGTAPHDLRLNLTGPDGELDGALTWTTAAGAQPRANLDGRFGTTPVSLSVSVDDAGGGNLSARYGEAQLSAVLSPEESGPNPEAAGAQRTLAVDLQAPAGSLIAYGLSAYSTVQIAGTDVTVSSLNASLTGLLENDEPLELRASGPLTGGLDLSGTLSTPPLQGDVALALVADALSLTWHGWPTR